MSTIATWTKRDLKATEDQTWIAPGGVSALRDAQSITLDRSEFTEADHYPDGTLPSGTVLGVITATGKYGPYDNAETNGTEVAAGFLAHSVPVPDGAPATADIAAALYWHGMVDESELPISSPTVGHLDAAGKTDLASKFRFV